MKDRISECEKMPDPDDDPACWTEFMKKNPRRWNELVNMIMFHESCCDSSGVKILAHAVDLVMCSHCDATFPSKKACGSHARAKHGVRCDQRYYADGSATCLVCATSFSSRLRVLAHLCRKNSACWAAVCSSKRPFRRLTDSKVAELDAIDAAARLAAQREGRSTPLALRQRRRANGNFAGRAILG